MKLRTPFRRSGGFTLVELLVVIGIIALLMSILLPILSKAKEEGQKVKCANNLRQIYAAFTLYSNQNGGYPRTYFKKAANGTWATPPMDCTASAANGSPTNGTAFSSPTAISSNSFDPSLVPNSVSTSIFLLVKTQAMDPALFVCPSAPNAVKGFTSNHILDWSNFEDSPLWGQTMTYSFNCMFPSQTAANAGWSWSPGSLQTPQYALAADMNPGIVGGFSPTNNVTNVTHVSSTRDMQQANSNNHKNKGQNVLYSDSSVSYTITPFCGPALTNAAGTPFYDNIYTVRSSATDEMGQLVATLFPYDPNDCYLVPTDDGPADSGATMGF